MDKSFRDAAIATIIKSNLISFSLSAEQIDKITSELSKDIFDILDNYDTANSKIGEEE
jgi:hypothetical protein